MPTLVRFLIVVAILAVAAGAAVVYLANFIEPTPREMTVRVPPDKLVPEPVAPPPAPAPEETATPTDTPPTDAPDQTPNNPE